MRPVDVVAIATFAAGLVLLPVGIIGYLFGSNSPSSPFSTTSQNEWYIWIGAACIVPALLYGIMRLGKRLEP